MRFRWMILLLPALSGCSWLTDSRTYSVYFLPYSSELDQQARETIHDAADFARAHPLQAVFVTGFSAPPDPKLDVNGLSAHRAEAVEHQLIVDGVGPNRITTAANGVTDPKTLPSLAVRRVDISVGH
jgi:outer membrane protein OmpA-like peptidoglycan-associated protein